MSDSKKKDTVFNTGKGGFVTVKNREKYFIFEFTQKTDADLFLQKNKKAEKLSTHVKYNSTYADGKWTNVKVLTYKAIVRK